MKFDAMIIGGGAAGLAAAVSLARGGLRTAVLEAQPRVGRKLLATGNGRCNLTNVSARSDDYFGARALAEPALRAFPPDRVLNFFAELGIPVRTDDAGRAYPMSNQAASVLDALRLAFLESGGAELTGFRVVSLSRALSATAADGRTAEGRVALVATGGLAAPSLGAADAPFVQPLGHAFTRRFPALAPIITDPLPALKGLRAHCVLMLNGRSEAGEMLFTEYGVSGIAAMQLSRFAKAGDVLKIDFCGGEDIDLAARVRALPDRRMEDFLNGIAPKRIAQAVAKAAGLPLSLMARELSNAQIAALETSLRAFELIVRGVKGFEQAQVTAGGLSADGFCAETLESKFVPGLFAAGEVLDVDGPCGGYNLQWAWASGLLAAEGMEKKLRA